ncbi:DNA-processing protein DprA [Alkalitalea saponilacus]|uniref:DNA processing protein n=1 Tax=Alkalitalea saponilacus TaxID=889453 RepID=A0A1T5BWD5_9BACT|nr:DNA-processing protein DprA [Alkalitalea saponilacus]ASB49571.1 DNA-protecting protein DprA [Alkalitalea saponilacus]SKB51434.1 DNA processing protein [Alkalitalea saponilacus]
MNSQIHYQIAISLIKGIGPKLARNLIAYLGSIEAILDSKSRFEKIPGIGTVMAQKLRETDFVSILKQAEKEMTFVEKEGLKTLFFTDEDYPRRLSFCEDAPLMLYYRGNASLDATRMISVVGTRRPSDNGMTNCEKLIQELAVRHPGTVIVSGLAYGIDICAHRAALRNNLPTIAVLAHGLDRIYPGTHHHTAREIAERGGLLTEFMTETNPDRPNFVKRNRIVAGLCDAVVVVESARKGGALITAGIANSYSRDVLAFPGRVNDEASGGCNKLIKTNIAALIEDVDDLEYALGWESKSGGSSVVQGSLFASAETPDEKAIMEVLLAEKEMNLNLLGLQLGMPIGRLSATLLDMEFKGLVKSRPGGVFKLL